VTCVRRWDKLVPPRPLLNKPVGGTLNIAYFREVSSPDGFQATGAFNRMYFYAGNEVLAGIGKDSLYDPAESLAYAYEVMDDGKRHRFHLCQGVQFLVGALTSTRATGGRHATRSMRCCHSATPCWRRMPSQLCSPSALTRSRVLPWRHTWPAVIAPRPDGGIPRRHRRFRGVDAGQ
jgi:hypothetical protein